MQKSQQTEDLIFDGGEPDMLQVFEFFYIKEG